LVESLYFAQNIHKTENSYGDTDPEMAKLIKRPQIIPEDQLSVHAGGVSRYQRPVKCTKCRIYIKRDPSVVDNRVVCPNCEHAICWICLDNAD
jgi:hypothetical protein